MLLATVLGLLSAVISVGAWWVFRNLFEMTGLYHWVQSHWFVVPLGLGFAVALYMSIRGRRETDFYNDALPDLVEEYHFGIQRSPSHRWGFRSLISFCGSFFGEIFGFEGGVLEGLTAVVQYSISHFPQRFHQAFRNDSEFRQTMVAASLSGTFAVVFNAPFAGALFALEILMVSGARIRAATFASAFASYGVARFFMFWLNLERISIVPVLFKDLVPLVLDPAHTFALSAFAALMAMVLGLATLGYGRWLSYVQSKIDSMKWSSVRLALCAASIMAVMAVLTPEAFADPARIWQDMALSQVSSSEALVAFFARAVLLSIALVGIGSSGLVTPLIFLASLLGYSAGTAIDSAWALPLALSCSVAALAGGFSAPLAAIALALELTHDGLMLWLAMISVLGALFSTQFFKLPPLLSLLLKRRGIKLMNGRCANVLASLEMRDAMVRDFGVISETATIGELQRVASSSPYSVLGVVSSAGDFRGLLSLDQLPNNIDLKGINTTDLLNRDAVSVKPNDPLEQAFPLLTTVPAIAVLDDKNQLLGLVFETGVLARYQREIGRRALSHYASRRLGKLR